MKAGLVGGSYQERSLPFDAQRTINLYPVVDETEQGKEVSALYATPGLKLFCEVGNGSIRGLFSSTNGRAFAISNKDLYEVFADGSSVVRGELLTNINNVTIEENSTQLAICDATNIYVLDYATNVFTNVTLPFSPALTIAQLDGYFIANTSQGQFYISEINDGLIWNASDFATAESSPDGLVRVIGAVNQLILLGSRTVEYWNNTGNEDFPFERVARAQIGCASPYSVIELDNSVIWVGQTKEGQGTIYQTSGYTPTRISTFAIEYILGKISDLSGLRAYSYLKDGHLFYILTGDKLPTTLVYDLSTGLWHERAYLENSGFYSTHKGASGMFAFNKILVGDKNNGNIYHMSLNYYDDDGQEIKAQRTFTHIGNEGKSFSVSELQVDFEYGVGLESGQGSDPQVWLEVSIDGGRTWGNAFLSSIGKIGQTKINCNWRRLGLTQNLMTFRISISDPVKRAICGAYFF